jgi:hypothetical protein
MEAKKYQLLTSNNGGATQAKGGLLLLLGDCAGIVISSEYLHENRNCQYFMKSDDPGSEPVEFRRTEEIKMGTWASEPPPFAYRIEFVGAVSETE